MIRFRCPCGRRLKAHVEHAGRRSRCPQCHGILAIPAPSILFDDSDEAIEVWRSDPDARPGPGS